jgi:hypothetical protein
MRFLVCRDARVRSVRLVHEILQKVHFFAHFAHFRIVQCVYDHLQVAVRKNVHFCDFGSFGRSGTDRARVAMTRKMRCVFSKKTKKSAG